MATPLTPVALAACGAVTALGRGVHHLDSALADNRSGLRPNPRHDGRGYMTTVAGWLPDDTAAALAEPLAGLECGLAFRLAHAALAEAQNSLPPGLLAIPPNRRALVLSTTKGEIQQLERWVAAQPLPHHAQRQLWPAGFARDLAAAHNLTGPVQCVSAACVSGLLALQQGASLLQRECADLAFVVGVDCLTHFVLSGFSTLKSLEPDGCRPFDQARAGLSLGEGAGAIALVRADMLPPPTLRLRGWGTSNDANHLTGPSRDGAGLALAIRRALDQAALPPDAIDYLNAHGTGTPYNDAMEALALKSVFGEAVPPFSSSKGLFGHTLGAAGVLETILCARAAHLQLLPGTPRLQTPDPAVPASVLTAPRPAPLRHLLKLNCGFAGTNAALLLECLP